MPLKVGDKIQIKGPIKVGSNLLSKDEPENEYFKTFKDIIAILKSSMAQQDKLKWCSVVFNVLDSWFNLDENEELKSCRYCKDKLIPSLHNLVEKSKIEYMPEFFDYYKRAYAFAARRDFECFVDYMEWNEPKKVYANRRTLLEPYVKALGELPFDKEKQYLVVSYPPSAGKSYIATLYSAWGFGLSTANSIIRMSYSDELVLGFSRTIKNYISSPQFAEVFTNFKLFNGKPFEVERESDWKIKNANVPKSSHIARTRNGSTTGERATFAIIFDDMTKGAEEANSESTHRQIYDKWLTEWWNRRDGQRCNFIFLGTQWSPEDILNRIIVDRNAIEELKPTNNPYVLENSTTTVVRVPMLDDEGKTTCPEVYPQEIAEQIRDTTDPFLFSCVYQQSPIAPTGREFAYECIRTYDKLPEGLSNNSFATLDTARKGKDNVSMPIVKTDNNGNYYLVDAIFEQKAMDFLYDKIINKIIDNNVTLLVIENNIDTSLKSLLEEKLSKRGYNLCEIREKFNTVKKEERIKNNRGIVQKQMVFPEKMVFKPNTDVGRLMENLTKYSFDYANVHDDAPDSICMVASEVIMQNYKFGKIKAVKRWF